jgi:ribosomal protein L11 methyltransferase
LKWLQVSLVLDGELAEPVSELLHRYCKAGVTIEASKKQGQVEVRGYLPISPDTQEKQRRIEEGLWYLGRIKPLPPPTFEEVEDQDWAEAWKRHYRPILVGRSLLVLPAWMDNKHPDRIALVLDPGMAFGTGTHPTTQLSLEAIESHLEPGTSVLDLGTGSGILAIAAAKLGARQVLGLDTDVVAITAARENINLNEMGDVVEIVPGSLDAFPPDTTFDLIVVNILTKILLELLEDGLADRVPNGGKLILSGILDHQAATVIEAYQKHGLQLIQELTMDDWRALVFSKK